MNLQLTEFAIRSLCKELLRTRGRVSGRAVRKELKIRYGAVGKTERIFKIWRSELESAGKGEGPPVPSGSPEELAERLAAAEKRAEENLARAQLAEEREESHQTRWATEIDRLREQLRAQPNYEKELRRLQTEVTELTVELAALREAR